MNPGMEKLDRLLSVWEKLGERERLVLLTFASRLWNGQRKYGPLKVGKKDWAYEAIEEALDASVYLTALLQDKVELAFERAAKEAEEEVRSSVFIEPEVRAHPDLNGLQ